MGPRAIVAIHYRCCAFEACMVGVRHSYNDTVHECDCTRVAVPPPLLPDVLIQSAQSMYEINFACTRLPPLFGLGSSCQ